MNDEPVYKCVMTGDAGVGKSCLMYTYKNDFFPFGANYLSNYDLPCCTTSVTIDDKPIRLDVYGNFPHYTFEQTRPFYYPQSHVILLCFDLTQPNTFDSVKEIWHPQLQYYSPKVPVILVGMKLDRANDRDTIEIMKESNLAPIQYSQAVKMQKNIKAVKYLECSALTQKGVTDVFEEAMKAAMTYEKSNKKQNIKKKCCTIS